MSSIVRGNLVFRSPFREIQEILQINEQIYILKTSLNVATVFRGSSQTFLGLLLLGNLDS